MSFFLYFKHILIPNLDFNTLEKAGLDTYMLAGWLMAEFVTIHPFNDGNGRMCRLLLNFVFRSRGLPFYCPVAVTKKQRGHCIYSAFLLYLKYNYLVSQI